MSLDANAILGLGYACFVVAFVLYVFRLTEADEYLGAVGFGVLAGGLVLWAGAIIWRGIERGTPLVHGGLSVSVVALSGPLLLLPLSCGAIIVIIEQVYHTQVFSPFVILMMLGIGGYRLFTPTAGGLVYFGGDGWFLVQHLGALFGYSALLVAGVVGVSELLRPVLSYRVREYELARATTVENIAFQIVRWALLLLTASLAAGAVRSWLMNGAYWRWTLADTWMLTIWAVYSAHLHVGRFRGWAIATVLGMALTAAAILAL